MGGACGREEVAGGFLLAGRGLPQRQEEDDPLDHLVIDIDSTIWPLEDAIIQSTKEIYGIDVNYEDMSWNFQIPGVDFFRVLEHSLRPEKVAGRNLYPGVPEALRHIRNTTGLRLCFASHNHQPQKMREPVQRWLNRKLGYDDFHLDIGQSDGSLDKVQLAMSLGGVGLIDDKPHELNLAAAEKGIKFVGTKVHPWNKEVVESWEGRIMGFDSWFAVPGAIVSRLEETETRD